MNELLNAFAKAALIGMIFFIVGLVFMIILINKAHSADFYIVTGGGLTQFNPYPSTHDNARFCDHGFQCDEDTNSKAWQVGAGLKLNGVHLGLNWAAELYYADFGTMKLTSQFPPDANYKAGCVTGCAPGDLYSFKGDWKAHGPILTVLPTYRLGDFNLYGKAGIAIMFIKGHAYVANPGTTTYYDCGQSCKANTTRYGPVIEAGISYEGWRVKPFIEYGYIKTYGGGFQGFNSWQSFQLGARILF